jgi:hypothetical protein
VLAYATSPDSCVVHSISTQRPPRLHHKTLGGDLTFATSPASAEVQGGKPDVVFAVTWIEKTPFTACGAGSGLSPQPAPIAIVATLDTVAITGQCLAIGCSLAI